MHGQLYVHTEGHKDRYADKRTDRFTDRCAHIQRDIRTDRRTNVQTDVRTYRGRDKQASDLSKRRQKEGTNDEMMIRRVN